MLRKTASSVLAQNPNGRNCIICRCAAPWKHRTTIQRWLSSYRSGGIEELLLQKPRSGRPRIMNPETVEILSK
ncbi:MULTISPECIES: helix-turn-helix domain-containing protein [unclassified Microcoleus]|uniref:helix-turn-helix domain-containing protein n=1 Tax=unclassified Microcoleus TaxID=2642155 RepID=UPI00403F0AC0